MTAVVRRTGTAPAVTDPVRIAELRLALNEQGRFRTEQLTELAARAEDQSTNAGDPRDEVADALQAGAMSALAEIAAALVRMDVGRYGRCETCGSRSRWSGWRFFRWPRCACDANGYRKRGEHDDGDDMMTSLAIIVTGLIIGAVGLILAMFRRDEPLLGVVALVVALAAGSVSALYGGLDSV